MKKLLSAPILFLQLLYQSGYLAVGQIWAKKTRSILTTIGIVIGVASITTVISLLTGLKTQTLADFEKWGARTIWIRHQTPSTGPKRNIDWWNLRFWPEEFEGIMDRCKSLVRFSRIAPRDFYTPFVVRYGGKAVEGVNVTGIEPGAEQIVDRPVIIGRPFSKLDDSEARQVCFIDVALRDKLGLDKDCTGEVILVGGKSFVIIGVVDIVPEQTARWTGGGQGLEMFIPFRTCLKLTGDRRPHMYAMAESISTELSAESESEIKFFMRRMRKPRLGPGEPDTFTVQSVQSRVDQFNRISTMMTLVAGGVAGISLLVGGIGIMNIMLVSVSERTREIGLRKAVGAKKKAILTQFLVESLILCFFGGLIGLGLGKLLTMVVGAISKNEVLGRANLPLWAIVLSFSFCGIVGIIFGMIPAIKAMRLDPIEALRHE
ncbi:MAG: ABC transporter permease [Phycisphaerae bacterium]|nr:ABC transporter permease [Phycisphaerae bacterium]MDD5380778.1 ABC transporter permease [Phycisphaerae bacterium]